MKKRESSILNTDWFYIALLGLLVIVFFNRILFTDQIIRASDVITQFFWNAKSLKEQPFLDHILNIPGIFHANWDALSDGGRTLEGGWNAIDLLFYRHVILHFFPFPSSIAWLAVLSLFWGGVGTYFYCRQIGVYHLGAFIAGIIFALCTENSSLINAGHIQKIEAISWLPWILLFLEKGIRSGRFFYYAITALFLSVQFFTMHWQISFYSCLALGGYWLFHVVWRYVTEKGAYSAALFGKEILLAGTLVILFFSTIAMSFAPLVSWSQQSERGDAVSGTVAGSGAVGAEKGIGFEEGMSWSMPPEEILTFLVPGLVGYSRQEAGDNPTKGDVFYWGRMRFTQTGDYLGLLPWLLLPLPLIFRRDRYTWFFVILMAATLVMALGRYTFVYPLMFKYLPAFSKFRVPKMILFLFAFGMSVIAGKGIDVLAGETAERRKLAGWLWWCGGVVALTGVILFLLSVGRQPIMASVAQYIDAPTRYQSGTELIIERYANMLRESATALAACALFLALFYAWFRKWLPGKFLLPVLFVLTLADLWRVDNRFIVVTSPPAANNRESVNDVVRFLQPRIDNYRMQPLTQESSHYYAENGFANISAYVTISERRYKEYLDNFSLMSAMPDIMNLKYLIVSAADFTSQKTAMAAKYAPVFFSSNGTVVLDNKTVLPKAWLVPSAAVVTDPRERLAIMATDPRFIPAQIALVESPPPFPMAPYGQTANTGKARVDTYMPNRIVVTASANANAMLVLGEKYYRWWYARVDGKPATIYPVDHILRGVYLTPGNHRIEFDFDPLPFKIGKYLTLASLVFFLFLLGRELWFRKIRAGIAGKSTAKEVEGE